MYCLSFEFEYNITSSVFKRILHRITHKSELYNTGIYRRCIFCKSGFKPFREFHSPVTSCINHDRQSIITSRPYESYSLDRISRIEIAAIFIKHEFTIRIDLGSIYFHVTASGNCNIQFLKDSITSLECDCTRSVLNGSSNKYQFYCSFCILRSLHIEPLWCFYQPLAVCIYLHRHSEICSRCRPYKIKRSRLSFAIYIGSVLISDQLTTFYSSSIYSYGPVLCRTHIFSDHL